MDFDPFAANTRFKPKHCREGKEYLENPSALEPAVSGDDDKKAKPGLAAAALAARERTIADAYAAKGEFAEAAGE